MDALDDTRKNWSGKPGTASGPRLADALASRFAAGDPIRVIAYDYAVSEADVVTAIRQQLRDYATLVDGIGAAIERYDAPRRFMADPETPMADVRFGAEE